MHNVELSVEIYQFLSSGKVINSRILNNSGEFVPNLLFEEVMNNLDAYRTQYEMSGQELVVRKSFIFLRKGGDSIEDLKTDITMKAALLLLMLGKYINERNYRFSKLTEQSGGITRDDIQNIQEMEDVQELIEKAKLKDDLFTEYKNVLINRFLLLEMPGSERFILSDAGKAFFDEVVQSFARADFCDIDATS